MRENFKSGTKSSTNKKQITDIMVTSIINNTSSYGGRKYFAIFYDYDTKTKYNHSCKHFKFWNISPQIDL